MAKRIIAKVSGLNGTVNVYRDSDAQEFQCVPQWFVLDKETATYFTTDKKDAMDTACEMTTNANVKRNNPNVVSEPILVDEKTGAPIAIGDVVKTFRGEKVRVTGFKAPTHSGSTGRVYVQPLELKEGFIGLPGFNREYFPSVIGAKIVEVARG